MGRSDKGPYREGGYRPQRSKARRRSNVQREGVSDRSSGLVDRVKKMMGESSGQGIGPGRLCRVESGHQKGQGIRLEDWQKGLVMEDGEGVQFNKKRPSVDRHERRGVNRNLFGEEEKRSSVNRKLRDEMRAKKKSLRSGQSKHVDTKTPNIHYKSSNSKDKVFCRPKIPSEHLAPTFTNIRSPSSFSAEPALESSPSHSKCLESLPGYTKELPSLPSYFRGLSSLPRYSRDLAYLPSYSRDMSSLPSYSRYSPSLPSYSSDLTHSPSFSHSPLHFSADLLSYSEDLPHLNVQTDLKSLTMDSEGLAPSSTSSAFAKPLKIHCEDSVYPTKFSLIAEIGPIFSADPLFCASPSPCQTSFSSDNSVQENLNFSFSSPASLLPSLTHTTSIKFPQTSYSPGLLDGGTTSLAWDWGESSRWLSVAGTGGGWEMDSPARQLVPRVMWGQGEL